LVGQPIDPEVVEFREAFEARGALDEIIREGAGKMLQTAIETDVDDFVTGSAPSRVPSASDSAPLSVGVAVFPEKLAQSSNPGSAAA